MIIALIYFVFLCVSAGIIVSIMEHRKVDYMWAFSTGVMFNILVTPLLHLLVVTYKEFT